jgi:fructuronate reductase
VCPQKGRPQSSKKFATEPIRRRDNTAPFAILCCDSLPLNVSFLRGGVLGFARTVNADLADWIEREVAFPSSMVDRITPASTDATLHDAKALTGCRDNAAIEMEPFLQWVIEDSFPQGRPSWEAGGALFVVDVEPYERMKLRMLNGAHSMLAYAGFLAGHEYVRDVMADPALAALVSRHLEAAATSLTPLEGVDFAHYAQELQDRFHNPAIAHRTWQIAMDGTEKMPQRIWSPAKDALKTGCDIAAFAFATAAWMHYCLGIDGSGATYALRDPREKEIRAAVGPLSRDAAAISDALHGLPNLIPVTLRDNAEWRLAIKNRLATMLGKGMAAAISQEM